MSGRLRVLVRTATLGAAVVMGTAASAQTPVVEYYHLDALGSVRAVTNAAGAVVSRHEYEPFGEEWPPVVPPTTARQFTGKERDPETGLDYFGARYYRADLGQFTTVDPFQDLAANLVDPQRWNRYTYALNSPLKLTDPDGRNPVLVVGGIIWGLYEIASSISDAYATYQTVRDPNASTTEKLTTGGLFAAGMLPMVPGGAATAGRAAIRGGDELAEAARAARTLGRQGEEAVRAAYDLGDKMRIVVNGRARVPDGLNELLGSISEVKNVSGQGFTKQLRDYAKYARDNGLQFDLYIRKGAVRSQRLRDAEAAGLLNLIEIP